MFWQILIGEVGEIGIRGCKKWRINGFFTDFRGRSGLKFGKTKKNAYICSSC
jgi:hypothetical protein